MLKGKRDSRCNNRSATAGRADIKYIHQRPRYDDLSTRHLANDRIPRAHWLPVGEANLYLQLESGASTVKSEKGCTVQKPTSSSPLYTQYPFWAATLVWPRVTVVPTPHCTTWHSHNKVLVNWGLSFCEGLPDSPRQEKIGKRDRRRGRSSARHH